MYSRADAFLSTALRGGEISQRSKTGRAARVRGPSPGTTSRRRRGPPPASPDLLSREQPDPLELLQLRDAVLQPLLDALRHGGGGPGVSRGGGGAAQTVPAAPSAFRRGAAPLCRPLPAVPRTWAVTAKTAARRPREAVRRSTRAPVTAQSGNRVRIEWLWGGKSPAGEGVWRAGKSDEL